MTRRTPESTTRALGRRVAQFALVGAVAATPLAFTGGIASADTDWDAIAQCESSGNWNTNTGNGFSGGLQFTPSTWKAFGGSGNAKDASREEQIEVAEKVKAEQGMNAWPTCSKKTGQTSNSANSKSSGKSATSSSSSSDSGSGGSSSSGKSSGSKATVPAKAPAGAYTVRSGDTVGSIAAAHGTSVKQIAERNDLSNPDRITPGEQLALR